VAGRFIPCLSPFALDGILYLLSHDHGYMGLYIVMKLLSILLSFTLVGPQERKVTKVLTGS
jgi:hypothetical protein